MAFDTFDLSEELAVTEETENEHEHNGINAVELLSDTTTPRSQSNAATQEMVNNVFGNVFLVGDDANQGFVVSSPTSRGDSRAGSDGRTRSAEPARPGTTPTPGGNDKADGRRADETKPGGKGPGKEADREAGEGKPGDNPAPKAEATRVEVALGTNDLSAALGRNARLVRGQESDVLTLPNGYRIAVRKDNINKEGMVMGTVTDPNGRVTDIRIGKNNQPVFNVNDGADRTMIRVNSNGHIEAVRTRNNTYRLTPADF